MPGALARIPLFSAFRSAKFPLVENLLTVIGMSTPDHCKINRTVRAIKWPRKFWRGLLLSYLNELVMKFGYKRSRESRLNISCVVTNGFRKSLVFQAFAIAKAMRDDPENASCSSVLVICPLVESIVKDQILEA